MAAIPIAPGAWRITTALASRPPAVHAYLLETDVGFVLVDGGANTAEAWAALDVGVREVAGDWEHVGAHVVTHMHTDHIGLAGRVRELSAARLLMGHLDAERYAHAQADPQEEADYRERLLRENGAPEELIQALKARGQSPATGFVRADVLLEGEHGTLPGIPGWEFVWTPGHTAGHISLFRSADRVLIAGDAVLPRITPTVGVNRQRANPVGDYLEALQRLRLLRPRLILPGHGERIENPLPRLDELRDATRQESARIDECLTTTPAPAWEVARRRYPGRELPPAVQMLALRETLAHLQHLVMAGRAVVVVLEGGVKGFTRR